MLHVFDNPLPELARLHIRGAVVKSRPDARFDNLLQWLRKALEVPRLTIEASDGAELAMDADIVAAVAEAGIRIRTEKSAITIALPPAGARGIGRTRQTS